MSSTQHKTAGPATTAQTSNPPRASDTFPFPSKNGPAPLPSVGLENAAALSRTQKHRNRIRAHVLICWLALLLIRITERQTRQRWRRIALELGRLHQVTLQSPDGTVQQTTLLTDQQAAIYNATGIKPPPRITALTAA